MTDRELLELAAKAAGIEIESFTTYGPYVGGLEGGIWNPLTQDDEALRLAVKLRLEITWWKNGVRAESEHHQPFEIVPLGDDPSAATRLAIVRAAAEIGKAML